MKITKKINQIILEEIQNIINETDPSAVSTTTVSDEASASAPALKIPALRGAGDHLMKSKVYDTWNTARESLLSYMHTMKRWETRNPDARKGEALSMLEDRGSFLERLEQFQSASLALSHHIEGIPTPIDSEPW